MEYDRTIHDQTVALGLVYEVGLRVGNYGWFCKLGVLVEGVLMRRALLFGVYIRAP